MYSSSDLENSAVGAEASGGFTAVHIDPTCQQNTANTKGPMTKPIALAFEGLVLDVAELAELVICPPILHCSEDSVPRKYFKLMAAKVPFMQICA